MTTFRQRTPDQTFVIVASGDRSFVVKPHQRASNANTRWHPGAELMDAWLAFLSSIGAGLDYEIDDPTFARFIRRVGGESGWLLRTLDFAIAGFEQIKFVDWQGSSSICENAERRSSDHRPVEFRFNKRSRPKARRNKDARNSPIPPWLFRDDIFVDDWRSAIFAWSRNRSEGLDAPGEFASITSACASDWLKERCVEAKTAQHKFEIAISTQLSGRLREPFSMSRMSRRLAAYPRLSSLCELEVDLSCSAVYVRSTDARVTHIQELANAVVAERERDDVPSDAVSAGVTIRGSVQPKCCF